MLKSYFLSALFFMFSTSIYAQITYVPDDNFEQALIDAGIDSDGIVNDSVKTSDISGVLHLVVNSKNISSLVGMEDFASLLDVDCRDNQLTSVDISNNTALKVFNAEKNQLTNLDLSHNPELTWVSCADNELTSLNLNQNIKITFLKCDKNSISTLDASLLSGLQYLTCEKNQLTTLDISENKLLELLTCGKNKLTELDLHLNTTLTSVRCDSNKIVNLNITNAQNLTDLDCSNNKIKNLDISKSTTLTHLTCSVNSLTNLDLTKNSALEELFCSVNQITSLDLSENTALTFLDCGVNPITELNVSKNSVLSALMFYGTNITNLDLSSNSALNMVYGFYSPLLRTLNVNNGNNSSISVFNFTHCPYLDCIIVDNPSDANNGVSPYDTWEKDSTATYTDVCTVHGNTYVPDDNFEQALIDLGIDSEGTLDDSVSSANIYATTYLDVSNKNISDLTGIEEFIYLDTLLVNNNQVTELDISQNVKLKTFRCNNNQLDSINLYRNNLLTELNCSNNQLTYLIFWNNNALTKIYCNNNLLTELDVRDFNALTELNCSSNQLTFLNVQNGTNALISMFDATNNHALTCIPVDNPTDANNGVSPYDTWMKDATATYSERCEIPGMTYIPDNNFEQALINLGIDKDGIINNYVATSDIEDVATLFISSKNISDMTGIEDFVALTNLSCSSNPIPSLNLSQNSFLKKLSCYNNQLTELDVSKNDSLAELYCGHNKLTNLDLSGNLKLTKLDCSYNELTSLDVSQNTLLTELNFVHNQITETDISNNTLLQQLSCNENQLEQLDASQNTNLIHLYCSNNQLTGVNVKNGNNQLLTHFDATNNPDLTCIMVDNAPAANAGMAPYNLWTKDVTANYSIDCSGAVNAYVPDDNFEQALINLGIDSDGTLNDSVAIADIEGIDTLDLNNGNISDLTGIDYFTALVKLICSNNQLTTIDVSQNIALKFLSCYNNQITAIDVSFNTALDTLVLGYNKLTSLDVKNNTTLKSLEFKQNQISRIDLTHNPLLTDLACDRNFIISLNLSQNGALTHLRCSANQLSSLDVSNNIHLTYLACYENHINNLDVSNNSALTELWCYSNNLITLDLTNNTNLTGLYCNGNDLTNINTAGLTALETIWCYENQLTDLDVRQNTGLRSLSCFDNLLANLNLQNGENTILHTMRAQINPNLLCIQVDNATDANNGVAPYDNWQKDAAATYSENCVQETVINDANFEQALIDLGIISESNPDGRVPTDEIVLVTKLDVSGMSISDLTGIADFTALDTLIVSDNQITYLDLTNNPNLVYVDVSNNPLTVLLVTDSDIIKAASLIENQNTTNENLFYINISGTDIASIDLSNVPNLETFIANGSLLASLDVSGNANLTDMDLTNCPLNCIQVSQAQFDNIPAEWQKETSASYSLDCDTATGIDEKSDRGLSLHPNPVSGILHVESKVPLAKIEFYSVTGEMVKVVTTDFSTVNLSSLHNGMYIVRIFTEDGVTIKKLMKK